MSRSLGCRARNMGIELSDQEPGRAFREAWIAGVRANYPGEPKPGYVTPWDLTPDWERAAAAAVETQIRQFAGVASTGVGGLTPDQRGRFVALCWIAQIHQHFAQPKASYVADWDDLPDWQRATDVEIFDRIAGYAGSS